MREPLLIGEQYCVASYKVADADDRWLYERHPKGSRGSWVTAQAASLAVMQTPAAISISQADVQPKAAMARFDTGYYEVFVLAGHMDDQPSTLSVRDDGISLEPGSVRTIGGLTAARFSIPHQRDRLEIVFNGVHYQTPVGWVSAENLVPSSYINE